MYTCENVRKVEEGTKAIIERWGMMRDVFWMLHYYSSVESTYTLPLPCMYYSIPSGREHSYTTFVVDDHILWSYMTLASVEKF